MHSLRIFFDAGCFAASCGPHIGKTRPEFRRADILGGKEAHVKKHEVLCP